MPVITVEDANYVGLIPEDEVLQARITKVEQRKKPFQAEDGTDIWRMEFSFVIEEPQSPFDGSRIWGDTPTTFTSHPDCVTGDTLLLPLGGLRAVTRSFYSGPLVTISTGPSNPSLRVTMNHPVLTHRGWVRAGDLRPGDYVVHQGVSDGSIAGHHLQYVPAFAEEVFEAALSVGNHTRVVTTANDFHGDARFFQGQVDVVSTDGLLWRHNHTLLSEQVEKQALVAAGRTAGGSLSLYGQSAATGRVVANVLTATPSVGGFDASPVTTPLTDLHARFDQYSADDRPADIQGSSDDVHGFAGAIPANYLTPILRAEVAEWSGHVYNLHTSTERYMADNIVVHNCKLRAWAQEIMGGLEMEPGFTLDTDQLVGLHCRVVVALRKYKKDGEDKERNYVRDVMRARESHVYAGVEMEEEPF